MEKVCELQHKEVDRRLELTEIRLNNHGGRIDDLEKYKSGAEVETRNLCAQIGSLVKVMWWFIGLTISILLGFFIWYIQKL